MLTHISLKWKNFEDGCSDPDPTLAPSDRVEDADTDVFLHVDSSNNLVAQTSLLENYLSRGEQLDDVCLWDYISCVEKVSISKDRCKHCTTQAVDPSDTFCDSDVDLLESDSDVDNGVSEYESEHCDKPADDGVECLWDLHLHSNKHLKSTKQHQPCIPFASSHPDVETHYQKVLAHSRRLVPVPLGPSIPQHDRKATKERHAQLMLILLKPWKCIEDLKPAVTSWLDAFAQFTNSCHPWMNRLINNMQILHEYRDSQDDHFAKRNVEHRAVECCVEQIQNNHNRSRDVNTNALDKAEMLT